VFCYCLFFSGLTSWRGRSIILNFARKITAFFSYMQIKKKKKRHEDAFSCSFGLYDFLVRQSFIAGSEVDDAAVGKSMLGDVVLHDGIVTMGVNADVRVARETIGHDVIKHMMRVRITGDAMDYMVRHFVVQPPAIVYCRVGRFRRRNESEIRDHLFCFLYHVAHTVLHVGSNNRLGRIAVHPLMPIAGRAHNPLGCVQDLHDCRQV